MKSALIIFATLVGLGQAKADTLNIVTDIAPVGSIVSLISGHAATVLIEPGQDPHDASLKPSMARALQNADLVIWMGEAMAPGLVKPIAQLGGDAEILELLGIEGIDYLEAREAATFESDEDGHEDHDDHAHDHHHDGIDPHAWLSGDIVQAWTKAIGDLLIKVDPANQDVYAGATQAAIDKHTELGLDFARITGASEVSSDLLRGTRPVVALHDAFQYLESDLGLNVIAAISDADGSAPSAARVSQVTKAVSADAPLCLISDTAETGKAGQRMAQTLGLKLVSLDILGARQEQGPDLYHEVMKQIAVDLKDCL
jgi:zinc transport system substrate-binding protein